MNGSAVKRRLRRLLLNWFDRHKRDLPWRQDHDPYRVWLSEVMLQQTRVAAAIEHYERFMKRFPTIKRLAAVRECSVLAAWSGLGYYRRARMLHAAARKVVKDHAGKFPATARDLRALPGIGRYTAAAIASIAFAEPVAAVDGNIERVLQRVYGESLSGESLWNAAQELLSQKRPGDFNQAMMELGAVVCLPRQPRCLLCPLTTLCATRGERPRAAQPPRQAKREVHYGFDYQDGSVFLTRRSNDATLMPGMWELPEISGVNGSAEAWLTLRHSVTVTDYVVRVVRMPVPEGTNGRWVPESRIATLPLTGLTRKILLAAKII